VTAGVASLATTMCVMCERCMDAKFAGEDADMAEIVMG
jgi:hypothetical protein